MLRGKKPDSESLVREAWRSGFGWFEKKRFPKETTEDYRARVSRRRFELAIKKQDCFAWTVSPFQYADSIIEATVSLDPANGHSAAGFVFRYTNEDNFYYFLVSTRGLFRFDVVFNRNPLHLIEWTPVPQIDQQDLELRIIANGDRFSFFIADEWIAELADDTLRQGYVGFAGQNYDEKSKAKFYLKRIRIESRPLVVEKEHLRWTRYIPASPESRITLARTLSDMGKFREAVAQLQSALGQGAGGAPEHLLLARAYMQLKAYTESVQTFDRCLELDPENTQAVLEKADVLFLSNDYLCCRDYIESVLPRFPEDAQLRNLLGSSEYSLGNWEKAGKHYEEAVRLDPQSAVFRINLGRCQERGGELERAIETYLEAASRLFKNEQYEELSFVLGRVGKLVPEKSERGFELKSLEAKMLFHEGKKRQAELFFKELIDSGYPDSGVHYLYALLLIEKGDRRQAEEHLNRAVEIEPAYPLYWFRLAENRFLLGEDPEKALEKACQLDPEDPWINNLYGQVLVGRGRLEQSLTYFEKAGAAVPDQADIYKNHAEVLVKLGRAAEAEQLLSKGLEQAGAVEQDRASLHNQRGNSRVELKNFAAAVLDYEEALKLVPENRDYMENCAACCLELDMIMRTEELLNKLLDGGETASLYNLTGNLAAVTGEYERARLAYLEGLKLEEDNLEIKLNLLSLYVETGKYREAKDLIAPLLEDPSDRVLQLQTRLRDKYESCLCCEACGRQWWLPKEIPPQSAFTVHGEPPGEAPAGRCEKCGKVYCIACAAEYVEDGRLMCPKCKQRLRLSDDSLKYLLLRYVGAEDR